MISTFGSARKWAHRAYGGGGGGGGYGSVAYQVCGSIGLAIDPGSRPQQACSKEGRDVIRCCVLANKRGIVNSCVGAVEIHISSPFELQYCSIIMRNVCMYVCVCVCVCV